MRNTLLRGGALANCAAKPQARRTALLAVLAALGVPAAEAGLDLFEPPPLTDPSAFSGPPKDAKAALEKLSDLPHANEGALGLPNGEFGDEATAAAENTLPEDRLTSFNYPTNGLPSPLFGAQSFTQPLLRFEEFGVEPLDPGGPTPGLPFPPPRLGPAPEQDPDSVARSVPERLELEDFLRQPGIAPFPAQFSNTLARNPWTPQIEDFLNRRLHGGPAEGRPPGQGWSHQRWNEFYPQVFFKTAQAGARANGGLRDGRQLHRYRLGEFGPGGLYHNTAGLPSTQGTTKGIAVRFHPAMPVQAHDALWTFDGTLPPKLLMARHGQAVLLRHYNALPIDPSANRGFGLHTITTHEHNGHAPAESDGYANAFFFPGQFYDYRWPLQLAGYDSINTTASDPRAAFPCAPGEKLFVNDLDPGVKTCDNGSIRIRGDWRETMSTHWFHDHMLDFTAQNVYKGNAAMMNYYSAVDRGREEGGEGKCHYQDPAKVNLCFPSGTALPWGNRDYDVNLVVADKAWDRQGQLWFNPFNEDGFLGDRMLSNWLYHPYLDVRARRYRFRILNGSVSRYFSIAVVHEVAGEKAGEMPGPKGSGVSYKRVSFHLIASDGNVMEHAVPFDGSRDLDADGDRDEHKGQLPTMGIAERFDIVIDFAAHGIAPGDRLYLVNVKEHATGKGSRRNIPLADVLSGKYKAVIKTKDGRALKWDKGDPAVGKFMELRVQPYAGTDLSMNPADYEPGARKMIPLWLNRDDPADRARLKEARQREFIFGRSGGSDEQPWTIKTDGGDGLPMDPRLVSAAPQLASGPTDAGSSGDGTLEVWKLVNGGGGWSHPVHVHFEEGIILRRAGKAPPEWEKWARKDIFNLGIDDLASDSVEIAMHFREFAGTYMEHCHNTQHEDTAMLLRWDLEYPGQFQLMPAPLPTWDGVEYVDSAALPTFRTGSGARTSSSSGRAR